MGNLTVKESGEMINFISPNVNNITSFKVHFSPRQEGTGDPSPENVREITGWNGVEGYGCGKNLFDSSKIVNKARLNQYGELLANTEDVVSDYIKVQSSNTYTVSGFGTLIFNERHCWYDKDKNYLKASANISSDVCTLTVPSDAEYVRLTIKKDYIESTQIELGSQATSYEPYQGATTTTDWTEDIGTVYGGYVDLISGELVKTHYMEYLTKTTENISATYNTETKVFFRCLLTYTGDSTNRYINELKCNKLNSIKNAIWTSDERFINTITTRYRETNKVCMNMYKSVFNITDEDSLDDMQRKIDAYLQENPIQVSYKMKTPITHQLTSQQLSTLKGQNNFWSNADYVEIEYELTETFDIQKAKRKIILNQPHVESASGDIVTFDTDMKGKLKECKVYFSPVQEGEGNPSPNNVRNIVGWNGVSVTHTNANLLTPDDPSNIGATYKLTATKKMLYDETEQGFYTDPNTDGVAYRKCNDYDYVSFVAPSDITVTFSLKYKKLSGSDSLYRFRLYKVLELPSSKTEKPSQTQLLKTWGNKADAFDEWLDGNYTVTLNKGEGLYFLMYGWIMWKDLALVVGDSGISYEDGIQNSYSVDWTDSTGTVYGGYVDLVSGELVQTWKTVNSEDLTWSVANSTRIRAYGDKDFKIPEKASIAGELIGEQMYVVSQNTNLTNYPNSVCIMGGGYLYKYFDGTNYPQGKISYKLVTPIHYQLTPQQLTTLRGTNNIYSNTNEQTEIKYWKH